VMVWPCNRVVVLLVGALAVALVALTSVSGCSPRAVPSTDPEEAEQQPAAQTLAHTVREGESLWRVADLYYGDPARAAAVAADNGIATDTLLVAGSVLMLRFETDEYDLARQRAAALEPYNRGVNAMAGGDLVEAERQFRLSLRTVPDLADARYNLALVLLRRGQAEAAGNLLTALVNERPGEGDFGFALGNALFQQTRYLEAAQVFGEVLKRDAQHRRAAFGHARALHAAGSRQEAIAAWRRYLELDATSSWAAEARRHLRELRGG
jgi:tetratricopeptide (TPR) repeat protein